MEVKIKLLNNLAHIPNYAKPDDAGMDLWATSHEYKDGNHIYGTGIALEIPKGYVGLIFPRSSNRKTRAYLCNHVGIIDSGYRGEVMLTFKNVDLSNIKPYKVGDRIGQLMIIPYPQVTFKKVFHLSDSERGEGGHGSTGN